MEMKYIAYSSIKELELLRLHVNLISNAEFKTV